jgi:hypothetical protein
LELRLEQIEALLDLLELLGSPLVVFESARLLFEVRIEIGDIDARCSQLRLELLHLGRCFVDLGARLLVLGLLGAELVAKAVDLVVLGLHLLFGVAAACHGAP